MSDERLAWLRANNEPAGDHTSSLTADEVAELLDEVDRLRTRRAELGEYYIGSDSRDDSSHWAYITHEPCGRDVWTGAREPTNPDMAAVLASLAAHHCLEGAATDTGKAER